MTTKLYRAGEAEVTVADPEGSTYKRTRIRVATQSRALDGSLIQQRVVNKWRWEVEWLGLTSAQFTTLYTELNRTVAMTFVPPETGTFSVAIVGDVEVVDTSFWYDVRATLEEV